MDWFSSKLTRISVGSSQLSSVWLGLLVVSLIGSSGSAWADLDKTGVSSEAPSDQTILLNTTWAGQLGWNTSLDFCRWQGVTCNGSRVVKLLLSKTGLSGRLPGELSRLVALEQLAISGNNLTGQLPVEWSKLTALIHLEIVSNNVTGLLPVQWADMGGLQRLGLSGNKLTGSLPAEWSRLTALQAALLGGNKLTGQLPAEWSALSRLQFLLLSENPLRGTLPPEWGSMAGLTNLQLSSNNLTGTLPPEWSLLRKLGVLFLHNNRLTGSLPAEWGKLSTLDFLDLSSNNLLGPLPVEWGGMFSLRFLHLFANDLTGSLPSQWTGLVALQTIRLHNNMLTGSVAAILWSAWHKVSELDLHNNQLSGSVNSSATACSYLDLSNNKLSGTLPAVVSTRTVVLLLSNNSFRGSLPVYNNLTQMRVLSVGGNKDLGVVPDAWLNRSSFPNINVLDVGSLLQKTASSKSWKRSHCLSESVFNSGAIEYLISSVGNSLNLTTGGGGFTREYLQDMLDRVPVNTLKTFKALCDNAHVAEILGIAWGGLVCSLLLISALKGIVLKHIRSKATKLGHWSCASHLWATILVGLYWYDTVTDMALVTDVWPRWPAFCLLGFTGLSYAVSGAVLFAYLTKSKVGLARRMIMPVVMPFWDMIALLQHVIRDVGLPIPQVANMDVDGYQRMRTVVKALVSSVPTAILTSGVYIRGNRPSEGLILTEGTVALSLVGSLAVVIVTWAVLLYKSDVKEVSVFEHLKGVFSGQTLAFD